MSVLGRVASLLLPFALASCTVGPDYEPPKIGAPAQFVSQDLLKELGQGEDESLTVGNWWEGFNDPLLNSLVADALEHNLRIAVAVARLEEARAELRLADAGDRPRVQARGQATVEEERVLDRYGMQTTTKGLFGALSLVWPIDLFGRTRRRVEAARAVVEATEAQLRGLFLSVSSQVAREYLRLRGNQRQLALLRESVALQEKTLSIVRSRFEAGLSPELDLRRAETSVERLRANIPPLEEALINTRHRLANLTGRYPGDGEAALAEEGEIPTYAGRFAEVVPLQVLHRRPDIHEAEARLKQAIAEIGIAEAEYYPTFELASQISISSTVVEELPAIELLIGSVSALIVQSLYEGGARAATVDAAEAGARATLLSYKQALLDAIEEVETTLAALAASRDRQASLANAVEASTRSFNQAENLYQQGLISFLDVVDAQRVLADAEQALAAERTEYATRIATLFRVLGTESEIMTQSPDAGSTDPADPAS